MEVVEVKLKTDNELHDPAVVKCMEVAAMVKEVHDVLHMWRKITESCTAEDERESAGGEDDLLYFEAHCAQTTIDFCKVCQAEFNKTK